MSKKFTLSLILVLFVLLLLVIATLYITTPAVFTSANNINDNTKNVETGGIALGQKYSLVSHEGQRITQHSFPDHYKLIYFGFTYCPDICPTSLHKMIRALENLPENMQKKIQPLFITVDPERDTQKVMAEYAPLFHPRLIGLTGSRKEVEQAIQSFRVYAQKDDSNDTEYYMYNHSSFIYFMAPDNTLIDVFGYDVKPADITPVLRNSFHK